MDELVEFIVNNIDVYDFNKHDLRDAINKYYNENYDRDLLDEIIITIKEDLMKVIREKKNVLTDENIRNEVIKAVKNRDKKLTRLQFYTLIAKYTDVLPSSITKKELEYINDKLIGSFNLNDWYTIYEDEYDRKHHIKRIETKQKKQIRNEIKERHKVKATEKDIGYPFRSKQKTSIPTDPFIRKDELSRPYYSPYLHSWEIDFADNLIEQGDKYFFCINVNTRFLVMFKGPETKEFVRKSLHELIERFKVKSVRGDGALCFTSNASWLNSLGINTYFTSEKMTFHNKIVDSVIRTIRNAIGYRKINDAQLVKIVDYYNNTYHESIGMTPMEMMRDEEKEWEYIRSKDDELKQVVRRQRDKGLLSYAPGNVLLVHTDLTKTEDKNEKRRRRFDRLGVFQNYVGATRANVRVKIYRPILLSTSGKTVKYVYDIIVPVYYTRKISESVETIPEAYKDIYFVE